MMYDSDYVIDNGILIKYQGSDKDIIIPEGVTVIKSSAFHSKSNYKSIVFPSSLKIIESGAFAFSENLTTIELPEGLEKIGLRAFSDCKKLISPVVPSSVVSVENQAFNGVPNVIYNGILDTISWGASVVNGYVEDGFIYTDSSRKNLAKYIGDKNQSLLSDGMGKTVNYISDKNKSLVIPDSVTNIGRGAFEHCITLKSIIIPGSVTSIGKNAFRSCERLKSVVLHDGITTIEEYAFANCVSLKSIVIPKSVTSIERAAFQGCQRLESIIIPEGVVKIEAFTFSGCRNLKSIVIPDSIESIGNSAFLNCISLTDITIPISVISIGDSAFNTSNDILIKSYGTIVPEKSWFTGLSDDKYKILFPNVPFNKIPRELKQSASDCFIRMQNDFASEPVIKSYIEYFKRNRKQYYPVLDKDPAVVDFLLSKNLIPLEELQPLINEAKDTALKASLLEYSKHFTDNDRENQKRAEQRNLEKAIGLRKLTVADYRKLFVLRNYDDYIEIGKYKGSDETVIIPDKIGNKEVREIGTEAFAKCSFLKKIVIPDTVDTINTLAFHKCTALKEINITDNPVDIMLDKSNRTPFDGTEYYDDASNWEKGLFYVGKHLVAAKNKNISKSAVIRDGTIDISDNAFSRCSKRFSVTIPGSVQTIGKAFADCSGLENVKILNGVKRIGGAAFYNCTNLNDIVIPDSITDIGINAFYGCTGLTSIKIPEKLENINNHAFINCSALERVEVDNNNKTYYSDNNCIITKHDNKLVFAHTDSPIPNNIKIIGSNAFSNHDSCKNIKIVIPDNVSVIEDYAFSHCSGISEMIIPDSVNTVGEGAFSGCAELISVSLPKTLKRIEMYTFSDCKSLKSITIPEGVVYIGWGNICDELEHLYIPDSVEKIDVGLDFFKSFPNLVIHCNKNSYAHLFAKNKRINVELV